MAFQPGDSIYDMLRKLVESAGGTPSPGDDQRTLLAKYLTAIGGTPIPGDTFYDLLVKVVRIKGGTPRPGDTQWGLLVKWLETLGECRACGDSVFDLWKKILAAESEMTAEPSEVRVQQGATGITNGQPGAIDFGSVFQGVTSASLVFTVFNDGAGSLLSSDLSVPTGYTITNGLASSVAPSGSDTFTVRLDVVTLGVKSGNVTFTNNDSDENPFSFPVTGTVVQPLSITSSAAIPGTPWVGFLEWAWAPGTNPVWFGIEVNEDSGGFANIMFVGGTDRDHFRDSDDNPHTWRFRIAAFDAGFNRVTDWVEGADFTGPP